MTGLRKAGILWLVLALALCSLAIAQAKKQVDINSASETEMVSAGIEKVAAKKIVESRPFRNKAELVSRQLLTKAQYDKLKDSLIAKQTPEMKEEKK
jgi:DNA uptake protein ComE-like DNA-binding protein